MTSWLRWIFKNKEENPLMVWREVMWVMAIILIIWGMYRFLLSYPVWIEETVLKGIVFGLPVLWVSIKKLRWKWVDLGITVHHLLASVHMGLLLGMLLGLIGLLGNLLRYGEIQFVDYGLTSETIGGFLILAFITAFWEQLLFSGYVLRRLYGVLRDELTASLATAGLFVLIHLPALLLMQQFRIMSLVLSCLLLFLLQTGCGILRLRTGNLAAPLLAHALWGVTVYLFR